MRNLIVIGTEFMRGSEGGGGVGGWALRSKIIENIIFFGHPPPTTFLDPHMELTFSYTLSKMRVRCKRLYTFRVHKRSRDAIFACGLLCLMHVS